MQDLANIHFIYPEWFLALIPLVVLWWFFVKNHRLNNNWQNIIDKHLLLKLSGSNKIQKKLKYLPLLVALVLILTVLALSGPSFFQKKSPLYQLEKLQVILLDASISTYADDIKPSRFKRSILLIKQLLKQTKEGETMLIAFSGEPYIISPPTSDAKPIINLLDGLTQNILPVGGQNLNLALKYSKEIIAKYKNKSIDILLLTDDNIVGSDSLETAKQLYQQDFRLSVLVVSGDKDITFNNKNIVKANTRLLQLLAKNGGGIYQKLTNDVLDIKNYLNFTEQHLATNNKQNTKQIKTWINSGIYLVFVLLLLVSLMFRGGYFLNIAIFVILFTDSTVGYASDNYLDNIWQTNNSQAKQYYNNKQYQKAADKFTNKNWQANALYKADEYESSSELFKELGEDYNYANSLAKQNKYQDAIKVYDSIAKDNINYKNAQINSGVIKGIIKQKKQQQYKDGDKQQLKPDKDGDKQQLKPDKDGDKLKPDKDGDKQQLKPDKDGDKQQQNKDDEDNKDKKNKDEDEQQQVKSSDKQDEEGKQKTKQKKLQEDRINSQIKKQKLEQVFKKIKTKPINLLKQKFIIERRQRINNNSEFINKN